MLEIIRERVSPELYDALDRISGELIEIGYSDHLDAIVAMETTESYIDVEALVTEVAGIIRNAIDIVLEKFDITVDGETPLTLLYHLLYTLRVFEGTEDVELIEDILNTADDTQSAFAEILALRTPFDESAWMPYLLSVSSNLMDTIKETAQLGEHPHVEQDKLPAVQVRKLLEADPDSIVGITMESYIPLGVEVDTLFNHYKGRLYSGEGMPVASRYVEQLVKDLVGINVYAGVSQEDLRTEVQVQYESLTLELSELQTARRTLDSYLERIKC